MRNQFSRKLRGFTLVELLVVIAIIAVLASAGFAAGNAAIQKARRTTALSVATAVESAVNNFFNEYGYMPRRGDSDVTVRTDTDTEFLNVLLGQEGGGANVLNPRGIRFLSVREGSGRRNGLIYSGGGNTIEGLYDPWGGPFFVRLDLDYDERVTVQPAAGGSRTLNGRRVAVWSNGADFVSSPPGSAADDVRTWGP